MRTRPAVVVPSVVLCVMMVGGCQESGDWNASFVPVDSGGGVAVDIRTELHAGGKVLLPLMSWTPDGAALRVAGIGPVISGPPTQTTLWSVDPTTLAVTTTMTMQTSVPFAAVACYPGATACDLIFASGRVLRRAANGDTATILATTLNGFYVSENGRYFLYTESDEKMRLLDATTGVKTTLTIPDLTKFRPTVALSNDGAEVDVVADGGKSITRHRLSDGSTTTWTRPDEPGWAAEYLIQLKWVGSTLYALVEWKSALERRFIQYPVDGGPAVTLGTIPKGAGGGLFTWRPELHRMLVEVVSAQEVDPDYLTTSRIVRQFELELLSNGVAKRLARSRFGWLNMTLSPDGRTMAYGSGSILVKHLPE